MIDGDGTRFVKVCGVRTAGDIDVAVSAGADAIGFVWFEPSPRHLPLARIAPLAAATPVTSVLVTVGLDSETLVAAAGRAGVDAVQPHGDHAAVASAAARRMGFDVIRPLPAGTDPRTVPAEDLVLVDTPDDDLVGGTGRAFDWDLTASVDRPFLLAGGLTPDTVADAIGAADPFGVDASSGLESEPGVKDPVLIRRFVEEAKNA